MVAFFRESYLLPCNKRCRNREVLRMEVLKEFAGVAGYEDVLTDEALPTPFCSLGRHYTTQGPTNNGTVANLARLLRGLHVLSPDLGCADTIRRQDFPDLGCDTLQIGVSVTDRLGTERSTAIAINGIIALASPNLPPMMQGHPGFDQLEAGVEADVAPLSVHDPDADFLTLILETEGLVRIVQVRTALYAAFARSFFASDGGRARAWAETCGARGPSCVCARGRFWSRRRSTRLCTRRRSSRPSSPPVRSVRRRAASL